MKCCYLLCSQTKMTSVYLFSSPLHRAEAWKGVKGFWGWGKYRPFHYLSGRSCLCWKLMSLLIRFFNAYSDGKLEQSLPVVTAHLLLWRPALFGCFTLIELPCSQCCVLCFGGDLGLQGGELIPNPPLFHMLGVSFKTFLVCGLLQELGGSELYGNPLLGSVVYRAPHPCCSCCSGALPGYADSCAWWCCEVTSVTAQGLGKDLLCVAACCSEMICTTDPGCRAGYT